MIPPSVSDSTPNLVVVDLASPPTLRKTFCSPSFPRREPYRIVISFAHSRPVCMSDQGLYQRPLGAVPCTRVLYQKSFRPAIGLVVAFQWFGHGSLQGLFQLHATFMQCRCPATTPFCHPRVASPVLVAMGQGWLMFARRYGRGGGEAARRG